MNKIAIAGLPGSGKTTFIAALYYLLEQRLPSTDLSLARLPEESDYLQRISNAWLNFAPIIRSNLDSFVSLELDLKDNHGVEVKLTIPDLYGEEFEMQWKMRSVSDQYVDLIQHMDGLLLFISTDVKKGLGITDLQGLFPEGELERNSPEIEPEPTGATGATISTYTEISRRPLPFDAAKSPDGVKLVELLQVIRQLLGVDQQARLAIVLSAWDKVVKQDKAFNEHTSPETWLSNSLPLVAQYIACNSDTLEVKVFGVSAQGGAYDEPAEVAGLQAKIEPSERILVVGENDEHGDLTKPIAWLIRGLT